MECALRMISVFYGKPFAGKRFLISTIKAFASLSAESLRTKSYKAASTTS